MTWLKMRDDLIAQTKAFVQSVNGGKQQLTPQPAPVRAVPIEDPFAELVSDSVANTVRSEKSVAAEARVLLDRHLIAIGTLHDSIGRPCTKPIAGVTQRLSTINRVPERIMSALP